MSAKVRIINEMTKSLPHIFYAGETKCYSTTLRRVLFGSSSLTHHPVFIPTLLAPNTHYQVVTMAVFVALPAPVHAEAPHEKI